MYRHLGALWRATRWVGISNRKGGHTVVVIIVRSTCGGTAVGVSKWVCRCAWYLWWVEISKWGERGIPLSSSCAVPVVGGD